MNPLNAIPLTDATLQLVTISNLDLPFVILNIDMANEPRLHKIRCSYAGDRIRPDRMQPDSKRQNRTGSQWLMLDSDVPPNTSRNCECWK